MHFYVCFECSVVVKMALCRLMSLFQGFYGILDIIKSKRIKLNDIACLSIDLLLNISLDFTIGYIGCIRQGVLEYQITTYRILNYMSAHVLLNLSNIWGKRDKMQGLLSILSFLATRLINAKIKEHEC